MKKYGTKADGTPLKTQWETILYYLKTQKNSITQREAIKEFGYTRLSAIVKLIEYRTNIVLERKKRVVTTRYGGTTWVTEYWLGEDDLRNN